MTTLFAQAKSIEEVFSKEYRYRIPEYQRAYSWEAEQCQQLVDDLVASCKSNKNEQYFLGCIVIVKDSKEEMSKYTVIDGQQRLTTLLLLIKALHKRAGTHVHLEGCYRRQDEKGAFHPGKRVVSEAIEDDREALENLLEDKEPCTNTRFSRNLETIQKKLDESTDSGDMKLRDFIGFLLKKAVLLPIECDSPDSALRIFETLNNRGMPLTDADIFKATLYTNIPELTEKEEFVRQWNQLRRDVEERETDIDNLFRIHMHILRAGEGDTTKEIALRKYFDDKKPDAFSDSMIVMNSLAQYHAIGHSEWECWEEYYADHRIWWTILQASPIRGYWQYPLFVYLVKRGQYDSGDNAQFKLPLERSCEYVSLIKDVTRYCFVIGVVHTANAIKTPIYKACIAIWNQERYVDPFQKEVTQGDVSTFHQKLESADYGRYERPLVLVNAALHETQQNNVENRIALAEVLGKKCDVEHILPRNFNHYDGWTDQTHKEDVNKLGNLIPLEKKVNIQAKNEFFKKKKEIYKKSKVPEVSKLGESEMSEWTPGNLERRHKESLERLKEFFNFGKG